MTLKFVNIKIEKKTSVNNVEKERNPSRTFNVNCFRNISGATLNIRKNQNFAFWHVLLLLYLF